MGFYYYGVFCFLFSVFLFLFHSAHVTFRAIRLGFCDWVCLSPSIINCFFVLVWAKYTGFEQNANRVIPHDPSQIKQRTQSEYTIKLQEERRTITPPHTKKDTIH